MIVYDREKDQSIIIGDNIIVKILEVENDEVKIGIISDEEITAPQKEEKPPQKG